MEPIYGFASSRHGGHKKYTFKRMDCILLSTAVIIILTCGLWILFHTALKDVRHRISYDAHAVIHQKSQAMASIGCPNVCLTEQCMKEASRILKRVDTKVDPCDDFYKFACGNAPEDEPLLKDVNTFLDIIQAEENLRMKLREYLEDTLHNISGSQEVQKFLEKRHRLYISCLRDTEHETAVYAILRFLTESGISNWPNIYSNWTLSDDSMQIFLSKLIAIEELPFASIYFERPEIYSDVLDDLHNTSFELLMQVDRKYLFTSCTQSQLSSFMASLLGYLGVNSEESSNIITDVWKADSLHQELLEEQDFSNYSSSDIPQKTINCTYGRGNLNPDRWCSILGYVINQAGMTEHFQTARIIFSSQQLFHSLELLFNAAVRREIVHNLIMNFFINNAEYLRHLLKIPVLTRMQCLHPRATPFSPRFGNSHKAWQRCTAWMAEKLPYFLAFQYLDKEHSEKYFQQISSLLSDVKGITISSVFELSWMSPELRQHVAENVYSIFYATHFLGKLLAAEEDVALFHHELHFKGNFFANVLELKRFCFMKKMQKPESLNFCNLGDLLIFQANANAGGGEVGVNFGFHSSPVFDVDRPRYLNYGALGMILAHEIGHILMFSFRDFEHLKSEEAAELARLQSCLSDLYFNYDIPHTDIKVDGNFTYFENVADNIGVSIMFKVYRQFISQHEEEPRLPGVPYSNDQMVFISFAQWNCEFAAAEHFKRYLKDSHSPNRVRVQASLMQSREFSEVFNCSSGKPMNPVEKCRLLL